jgi:two-component system LytT family response regulator
LLILPIVENAFKHVSNFKEASKNKIHITLKKQDKNTFLVEAVNSYDQSNVQKHLIQAGGLGIQNLKRRLELLYLSLNFSMIINCLIVDDEPIARNGILEHIEQIDFLHAAGVCKNAVEASTALEKNQVDLVFLDIQMPKLSGIDFLKNLPHPPLVIFTTAYPEYAIEGYELNVLDYLLKPISFERFFKAVLKAQTWLNLNVKHGFMSAEPYFFIKSSLKIEKIFIDDILYLEALSNYVILHTKNKKHIVYMSFKGIESQLPKHLFLKTHKSFIVAVNAIQTIDNNEIVLDGHILPISKSYRQSVMDRVEQNLFKRM